MIELFLMVELNQQPDITPVEVVPEIVTIVEGYKPPPTIGRPKHTGGTGGRLK